MYAISSAFYSQSINEITEFNFQFILRSGLQASDNGGKRHTQFFILCIPVWERRLERNSRKAIWTIYYYLPLARRTEAILQTF